MMEKQKPDHMDDEQQYESASIIYGPGIQWQPPPITSSPMHLSAMHASPTSMQHPHFVDYYGNYQNEGTDVTYTSSYSYPLL